MLGLARKMCKISPSPTLAITSLAKAMIRQGKDVINLGAGEPDFDTPVTIKGAGKKAIDSGFTKYTPASGTMELKGAICDKFWRDNKLRYSPSQIVVSCGAKHSLYNIFQAMCNPGDEVIIISPYWVSYPEMVRLAGAKPRFVHTKEQKGFKATLADIKKAVSKKTKALIINSPSNPAGIVLSRRELEEIADIATSKKFYAISDEIYEKIIYDKKKHISIASLGKDVHRLTITVNGVSKAYSMTGWRIGYLGANDDVVRAISTLQSHSTSNPTSISQKAAVTALHMDESQVETMRKKFQGRRNLMMRYLDGIGVMRYVKPEGAFYIYCNVSKTGLEAKDFAKKLLQEKEVAVIPGEAFGSNCHIRLSYSASSDKIREGLKRIRSWLGR